MVEQLLPGEKLPWLVRAEHFGIALHGGNISVEQMREYAEMLVARYPGEAVKLFDRADRLTDEQLAMFGIVMVKKWVERSAANVKKQEAGGEFQAINDRIDGEVSEMFTTEALRYEVSPDELLDGESDMPPPTAGTVDLGVEMVHSENETGATTDWDNVTI